MLNETSAPVSHALILICEKCGKKVSGDSENNSARELQSTLKDTIKSSGRKGELRSVLTSCMDICPKGEIAIGISRANASGGKDQFFTIEPGSSEKMVKEILLKVP